MVGAGVSTRALATAGGSTGRLRGPLRRLPIRGRCGETCPHAGGPAWKRWRRSAMGEMAIPSELIDAGLGGYYAFVED
jgi:hypothetical protein